jgi:23S rRNA (adenine2503-C2)-methyltransferase
MQNQPIIKTASGVEPTQEQEGKLNLVGLNRDELAAACAELGLEKFRAKQIWSWVYGRGVTDFGAMSDIAKATRIRLEERFIISRAAIAEDKTSFDGTRKWLFRLSDGNLVETVYIPETDRGTLCISSQVGCTLSCTFCHTGTQKLVRNLTAGEIVGQVLSARDLLQHPTKTDIPFTHGKITNIVFMGMGEPLFNYDHVAKACILLGDNEGLALSRRHITISTSGVVPRMYQMADELNVNLAVSLHAIRDDLRNEIVPINRKYKLEELIGAMRHFHTKHPSRRIMIEYVMLKDVNDRDEDALQLVNLLKGLPVKMNLIPFNPWPGSPYECSSNNRIHAFRRVLQAHHLTTPIRKTRGQDILAACGQLKSASERKKGEKVQL